MLFDRSIDKRGNVSGGRVSLIWRLGDAQLAQELIEHLDGFCVLRGDGAGGLSSLHDVDRGSHEIGCSITENRVIVND